jgi:hypothetical protein
MLTVQINPVGKVNKWKYFTEKHTKVIEFTNHECHLTDFVIK